jgi:hypothetical protein
MRSPKSESDGHEGIGHDPESDVVSILSRTPFLFDLVNALSPFLLTTIPRSLRRLRKFLVLVLVLRPRSPAFGHEDEDDEDDEDDLVAAPPRSTTILQSFVRPRQLSGVRPSPGAAKWPVPESVEVPSASPHRTSLRPGTGALRSAAALPRWVHSWFKFLSMDQGSWVHANRLLLHRAFVKRGGTFDITLYQADRDHPEAIRL